MKVCAHKWCSNRFKPTEDINQKFCSAQCKKREGNRRRREREGRSVTMDHQSVQYELARIIAVYVAQDINVEPTEVDYDTADRFIKVIRLRYSLN